MLENFDREQHKVSLFEFQQQVREAVARYKLIAAGRRVGKSYLSCVMALEHSLVREGRRVIMVGPTYGQAKEALWSNLKMITHPSWVKKTSESLLDIEFINGSRITLKGADRPETLRGISPSPTLIVCDEFAYFKAGTFQEVLMPMSVDPERKADFMIISTPKGIGNEFHELWLRGQDPDFKEWKSWQFTCVNARPDMADEVELARNTLDVRTFNQEYNADFTNTGFAVFYPFKFHVHVDDTIPVFERGETVHLAVDFNVAVMAASAFAVRGGQMHFIKDYVGDANTEELCQRINAEYSNHQIVAYPDPSGKARKSSAAVGQTDFSIMQQHGWKLRVHNAAPPIVDSVNCVNRMLENASGNSNMFFRPECKHAIKSMSGTQWKESATGQGAFDNAQIDKEAGIEHHSDGIRYATHYLFPIKHSGKKVITSRHF